MFFYRAFILKSEIYFSYLFSSKKTKEKRVILLKLESSFMLPLPMLKRASFMLQCVNVAVGIRV